VLESRLNLLFGGAVGQSLWRQTTLDKKYRTIRRRESIFDVLGSPVIKDKGASGSCTFDQLDLVDLIGGQRVISIGTHPLAAIIAWMTDVTDTSHYLLSIPYSTVFKGLR
jgi:hypothetical protein